MVKIQRTSILNNATNELNIQLGTEQPPSEIGGGVNLVYPINQKYTSVFYEKVQTLSASTSIYTTPTDKDFYLTYLTLSVVKDAANDNTVTTLSASNRGVATRLCSLQFLTTTQATDHLELIFPYPIKLDRGTSISIVGSFAAGTMTKVASIGGFLVE